MARAEHAGPGNARGAGLSASSDACLAPAISTAIFTTVTSYLAAPLSAPAIARGSRDTHGTHTGTVQYRNASTARGTDCQQYRFKDTGGSREYRR